MILREGQVPLERSTPEDWARMGLSERLGLSDAGGLTQFGAFLQTLMPGARSSDRHWHEGEDELLYVLSGEATVIEDDGAHLLHPGDSAAWPAGSGDAHHVENRSGAPCAFLVIGTRARHDIVHYPDLGETLYTEGDTWRLVASDGSVRKQGTLSR